jgi:hypothetical protein
MVHFICTFIVLYLFVSMVWPSSSKGRVADARKHQEVLGAIARLERQSAPPVQRALPTFKSAERARVLALGRIRDGAKRHPILDTTYVSVAKRRDTQAI